MNLYEEDDFFTEAEKELEAPRTQAARQNEHKRKKKKKKKGRAGFVITIILLIIVIGLMGTKAFFQYRALQEVAGRHTETIDITENVASKAEEWLEDVEGVTVTTKDIAEYMGPLEIIVVTECSFDIYDNMSVTRELDPESYDSCRQKAYEGVTECFANIIGDRLFAAGIDTDGLDIDACAQDIFGMNISEYVNQSIPEFFPSYEELSAQLIQQEKEVDD